MNEKLKTVFDRLEDKWMYRVPGDPDMSFGYLSANIIHDHDKVLPYATQHELLLRLGVRFIANQAQYNDARKVAEMQLADALYSDVKVELGKIAGLLTQRDYEGAMKAVFDLRGSLHR